MSSVKNAFSQPPPTKPQTTNTPQQRSTTIFPTKHAFPAALKFAGIK
jgi:hypothetical protein